MKKPIPTNEPHYWAVKKAPKVKKETKMTDEFNPNVGAVLEKWFKLDALSSITAYELAQILQSMEIGCSESVLMKMPRDARRHFQPMEKPKK